ncbi:hypothetical protein BS78_05G221000 [Paspalum vaginatum]|uniref:Uncharacterized protein n=1 Tax=Paspalum vaginatum TaxID=158149 RepID=A0A9W7XCF9_9POAL|nr:hypothetical protein BS78_K046100 [Paspalum vaginatum]KAJ1276531.1 hypothetical protein BS78_05G221000 [Paspalum vaginatum]
MVIFNLKTVRSHFFLHSNHSEDGIKTVRLHARHQRLACCRPQPVSHHTRRRCPPAPAPSSSMAHPGKSTRASSATAEKRCSSDDTAACANKSLVAFVLELPRSGSWRTCR